MCLGCFSGPDGEKHRPCAKTFWVESPACLLADLRFVPNSEMTLEERFNAITRLVIIVAIILAVARYRHAGTFLLVALIIIVILYYANKRRSNRKSLSDWLSAISSLSSSSAPEHKEKEDRHEIEVIPKNKKARAYVQSERVLVGAGKKKSKDPKLQKEPKIQKEEKAETQKDDPKNPRRPYPLTVPEDMIVKSDRRVPSRDPGRLFNSDPKYASYVPAIGKTEVRPSTLEEKNKTEDRYERERAKNLRKSYQNTPKEYSKRNGYQVREFQEESEEAADEELDEIDEEPEVQAVQEVKVPSRRTFMPSNYESSIQNTPSKLQTKTRSSSAGRRARMTPKWGDHDRTPDKITAADIMFSKAAKLEKATNARRKTDKNSQINSIFSS